MAFFHGKTTRRCIQCARLNQSRVIIHRWYGSWFVLERIGRRQGSSHNILYSCRCGICDRIKPVESARLLDGSSRSCGCGSHGRTERMIGRTFGRWTVLAQGNPTRGGRKRYRCRCSCAEHTIKDIIPFSLLSGKSQSCGCLWRERAQEVQQGTTFTSSAVQYLDETLDALRHHAQPQITTTLVP
jgi:hypothetical protein